MRNDIRKWVLKNFGNIFSVFGVFATLYFGIFYIPDYIEESQNAKLNNASKEVIQSIKELVYSDSIASVKEIKALIRSKEVGANLKFENSDKWFLLRAEESFMEDKFIPLTERRKLIAEIENLTSNLPQTNDKEPEKLQQSKSKWISSALSILGTLLALLGGYFSFRANYLTRKSKDEEIENELKEAQTEIGATIMSVGYQKIEKDILSILEKSKYDINPNSFNKTDREFDFEFRKGKRKYFVEVKVLRASKVGLKSIESFLLQLRGTRGIGIFIYNTELTTLSASRIRDFNKIDKFSKVYTIQFTNKSEVEKKIKEIVEKTA
ncbi:hypothetical protein [Seonamhaeicola sp.]|uniref:hypothetical protein n=1 Tax=Seonamhaeicola sp. TaxID=1912245 RepID=UPI002602B46F|nr:hypothetical protein [Seonamhaeicola sp.]